MGRTQLPKTNSKWQWSTKYVLTENPTFASTLDDWNLRIVICGLEVWFVAGLLGKNVSNRSADVCMYFLVDNQDFYCDVTGSFAGGVPFQWHSQFNWGSPGWFWMSAVVLNTTEWEWTSELQYIKSKVQQCSGIKFQKSIVLLHTPHKKEHLLCRMSNLCEQPWLFRVYRG